MTDRARRRIGKGIYSDQYGLAATVKVRGQQREKRFPRDTDQDDQELAGRYQGGPA